MENILKKLSLNTLDPQKALLARNIDSEPVQTTQTAEDAQSQDCDSLAVNWPERNMDPEIVIDLN